MTAHECSEKQEPHKQNLWQLPHVIVVQPLPLLSPWTYTPQPKQLENGKNAFLTFFCSSVLSISAKYKLSDSYLKDFSVSIKTISIGTQFAGA